MRAANVSVRVHYAACRAPNVPVHIPAALQCLAPCVDVQHGGIHIKLSVAIAVDAALRQANADDTRLELDKRLH